MHSLKLAAAGSARVGCRLGGHLGDTVQTGLRVTFHILGIITPGIGGVEEICIGIERICEFLPILGCPFDFGTP